MASKKNEIVAALVKAYMMEVETIVNYLSLSIHLDGIRADFIKQALAADIPGELGHAQRLGQRLKQLGSTVPGSQQLAMTQNYLQPPADTTDLISVIKGVIQAEEEAIAHYRRAAQLCEGDDYVTQDLVITIMGEEEAHLQQFQGFLKEFTRGS
jgi:bacterioferritin